MISVFQNTFSEMEYDGKKKRTRRDRFLAEIEKVTPWVTLMEVIAPIIRRKVVEVVNRLAWHAC